MMKQTDDVTVVLKHAAAPASAIDLSQDGVLDRQSILASLQAHFHFPGYFGDNFDAAYDLLLDVVDTLTEPTVWCFCAGSQANMNHDALISWQQLMQDLMQYACSKGASLQVELFIEP